MQLRSSQSFMGAALIAVLAGACGGGGGSGTDGAAGGGGIGGAGGTVTGLGGAGAVTGCGFTCAQYGAECGMFWPAGCEEISDCGRCPEPQVCGGQGVPNRCARPGTWTIDEGARALLSGDVLAIWGPAANNVWAGDSTGRVIWWNGSIWQVGADFGVGVTVIHGSSMRDVWFGLADGSVHQLVGIDLIPHRIGIGDINALWVGAPTAVFACDYVVCYQWDGNAWRSNIPNETGAQDAWAVPGGDLYVVSERGWMQRWDGAAWTEVFPRGSGYQFFTIKGTDADHIWAAGDQLLGLGRSGWRVAANPGQQFGRYTGVWASGPTDVWAVGTAGLIQHGDGTFFETQPSPTTVDLLSLWGSGPNDIWAGGVGRVLLHYTRAP